MQAQAYPSAATVGSKNEARERVFDAFRRWGYLQADLDPLGLFPRELNHPDLQFTGEFADEARKVYANAIGVEYMHIPDPVRRRWVQERMEGAAPAYDAKVVLDRLVEADIFEQMLQTLYIGTKRFSLEGNTSLIPMLDTILQLAAERGADECVMAMSHRGRLTVVSKIVGRPTAEIFAGFEDVDPRSVLGGGDVKYHQGATGFRQIAGHDVRIHLVSNPSHLEAVDPVAVGRVKAKQVRRGEGGERQTLPIIMHGDSAFAGQGIWAETLNLSQLKGYSVGGTVNIIVNNLIGFTTNPNEYQSGRFASDLAKRLPIPIFHVNAEDPEAVLRVARMAVDFRYEFGDDVIIDLIGYRRHGHSEIDDPTITQPKIYKAIKAHPPLYKIYGEKLGLDVTPKMEEVKASMQAAQKEAQVMTRKPLLYTLPAYWDPYKGGPYSPSYEVETGLPRELLASLGEKLSSYPADFNVHGKVKKLLEQRAEMAQGTRPVDYGMAEALAMASLAINGTPVRLSGQDSRRGTFNHRHSMLIDIENEQEYVPLRNLGPNQGAVDIYNSELSEAAVLGFEYGYSRDYPETLVMWEAQFGDFANGAQITIDQFISAGEEKWGLLSGVVMLLPHGYEGQGPEHSSARIERYLQLAARDNMQICQPSTAAQFFHLLRRQALRIWRKPLICFTPKSMLRHPEASSSIDDFTLPHFQNLVLDREVTNPLRILMATGKVVHELRIERRKRQDTETAIVALDQLFPFPEQEITNMLAQYSNARELVWVQEEPANMGGLFFVLPRLRRAARDVAVRSVKRAAAASPSTGSAKAHEMEQKTLITLAFTS